LAGWVKKLTGKPTIAVGSVGLDTPYIENAKKSGVMQIEDLSEFARFQSLEKVFELLEKGEFDLVSVGRAMLANPDWVERVYRQEYNLLVPFRKETLGELH